MANINIWYKRYNNPKYHAIKEWVNKENNEPLVSWDNDFTNKLFEFNLKLYNPIDSDNIPFIPQLGDEIAITDYSNNILFNMFYGIIEERTTLPKGRNETNTDDNHVYELRIKQKDFSKRKFLLERVNSSYIYDALIEIFNDTPYLGGVRLNGYTIPKHDYGGENFLLPPFRFLDKQFNLLVKILGLVSWGFSYWFSSELDPVNGIRVFKSITTYPKNSGRSIPDDWIGGINDTTWKNSQIPNIHYPFYDDIEMVITEDGLTTNENADDQKNYIELKLNVKTVTSGEGEKTEKLAVSGQTVYEFGGAFDIKNICIKKTGVISSVISTTVFKLTSGLASEINFYQVRMNDNGLGGKMKCKITSGSNVIYSNFSLNISSEEFTLETAISSLTAGDSFELVNCFDILDSNLESYPEDLNGYVIKNLGDEKSSITFTESDAPEGVLETSGDKRKVVIYYYPIEQVYYSEKNNESIDRIGLRDLEETIKEPVTPEQGEEIRNEYKKFLIALKTLDVKVTHRKGVLAVNSKLEIDFKGMVGNYIVTESKGAILSEYGRHRNKPLITQQLKVQNRKNNLEDVLGKIQNNSLALRNYNLKRVENETTVDIIRIKEVLDGALDLLTTPVLTSISDISANNFILHLFCSNTSTYLLDVSTSSDFSSFIFHNRSLTIIADPHIEISLNISNSTNYTYPAYVRLRAVRGSEIGEYSNVLMAGNENAFEVNSNLIYYFDFQEGSGSTAQDKGNNNIDGYVAGTLSGFWASGINSGDTYAAQLNGTDNYIYTSNNNENLVDFTIIKEFIFTNTGDKSSKTFHPITGKYDSYLMGGSVCWVAEYISFSNEIAIYIWNSSAINDYRAYYVPYTMADLQKYIIQIAFKLDDPSNSNLNTCEICVDGIKITGGYWVDVNISNITAIKNINQSIWLGAERGAYSTIDYAKYKLAKSLLYKEFRTEAQALIDAQAVGLA